MARKLHFPRLIVSRSGCLFVGTNLADVDCTPPSMGQVVGTFHPRFESFFDYILFSIYVDVLVVSRLSGRRCYFRLLLQWSSVLSTVRVWFPIVFHVFFTSDVLLV